MYRIVNRSKPYLMLYDTYNKLNKNPNADTN